MLTLRQRIFLILSIIIAVVLAVVLFIIYGKKTPQENVEDTNKESSQETDLGAVQRPRSVSVSTESISNGDTSANQEPSKSDPALYARQLSRLFVERFATYSNQNNNAHIIDAAELATVSMSAWLQTQALEQSLEYKGVTTRVISSSVREESDTRFLIGLEAQQEWSSESLENPGTLQKELKQRKGRVELVKVGNEWKVNGFWWEN